MDFIKKLRGSFVSFSFKLVTVIHPETKHAFKHLYINDHPTNLGYDIERQAGHLSFAPFALNIGKPLPLIENLYITPQIGVDTGGAITTGIGIGPSF